MRKIRERECDDVWCLQVAAGLENMAPLTSFKPNPPALRGKLLPSRGSTHNLRCPSRGFLQSWHDMRYDQQNQGMHIGGVGTHPPQKRIKRPQKRISWRFLKQLLAASHGVAKPFSSLPRPSPSWNKTRPLGACMHRTPWRFAAQTIAKHADSPWPSLIIIYN